MDISVIIPSYKAGDTIRATLDSVCEQTRPPLEIVVVDDHSPDDTCTVIEHYIAEHRGAPAIRLLRQSQNGGPAVARNRGIREAHGDWIAFLDSDDRWLPHKLKVQVSAAMQYPEAALLCSPTLPLNDATPAAESATDKPPSPEDVPVDLLSLEDFIYANPIATSTVLANKKALLSAGGFDEQFRGPEDYDLWLRIAKGHRIAKIVLPLSLYRYTPGSLSMDERTFLPQIIAVMEKAFARGGALEDYASCRRRAYAEKYSSASWMAYNRGARADALRHLIKSYAAYPFRIQPEERDRLLRLKLFFKYLVPGGKAEKGGAAEVRATAAADGAEMPKTAHLLITLEHGGLEQCALQWCRERNRRHPGSTVLICLDGKGDLAEDSDEIFSLDADRSRFPWDRAAGQRLVRLIQNQHIDILHSHNTAARQYAALARRGSSAKHIYTDHGTNLYLEGIVNRLRLRFMRRHTDRYTAVSREAARRLSQAEHIPLERIAVISNGVAPPAAPADKGVSAGTVFNIGYVGRLAHEKGVDRLLKAFTELGNDSSVNLTIIGDGPARRELEELAGRLGIAGKVRFAGSIVRAADKMAGFDLFVLPSRSEGLPLALLEAIVRDVPVMTAAVGQCPLILENGKYGELLPDDESAWPEQMRHSIEKIRNGEWRERTLAAADHIRKNYSLAATVNAYEEIYRQMISHD